MAFTMIFGSGINYDSNSSEKGFFVDLKIKEEMASNSTKLKPDKEKYLNSLGVMDEDIESYTDEVLQEINDADNKDILIETAYYSVDDTLEEADTSISTDDCKLMSLDEINEFYHNEYYTDYNSKSFLTDTVNAVTKDTAKFSKTVTMVKKKKGKYKGQFLTTVTLRWLKMPYQRNIDKIYIEFDNATINIDRKPTVYRDCTKSVDRCTYKDGKITIRKDVTQLGTVYLTKDATTGKDLKNNHYVARDDYISIAFELHSDSYKQADNRSPMLWTKYYNERCTATFIVYKKNTKVKKINVYPGYVHTKTGADLVSIAADSVAASVDKSGVGIATMMFKLASGSYKTYSTCSMGNTSAFTFTFD